MKVFKFNDQALPSGVPFELDGISYPWNWFDLAKPEDLAEKGIVMEDIPDPVPSPRDTFYSQELIAQFTDVDIGKIQTAISADSKMLTLWYALLAQKDEMHCDNARVIAGWAELTQILGVLRMAEIAFALNIVTPQKPA